MKKNILAIALLFLPFLAFTQKEGQQSADHQIFSYVEQMPEASVNIGQFLQEHLVYPAEARQKNIQGRVSVKFVVNTSGNITNVTVIKSAHPLLDQEAVRVVKMLPTWKPGRQNGAPVNVYFTLPIMFRLENDSTGKR